MANQNQPFETEKSRTPKKEIKFEPAPMPFISEWMRKKIYGLPDEPEAETPYLFEQPETSQKLRPFEKNINSNFFREKAFANPEKETTTPVEGTEYDIDNDNINYSSRQNKKGETRTGEQNPIPLEGELLLPKYFDFQNSAARELRHLYPSAQTNEPEYHLPETNDETDYPLASPEIPEHPDLQAQQISLPQQPLNKEDIMRELMQLEQEREALEGDESPFDLLLAKRLARNTKNLLKTRTQAEHNRLDKWYEKAANQVMAGVEALGNRPLDAYLSLGYTDLAQEIGVLDILNRAAKKKPLTRSEKLVLKEYAQLMRANDYLAEQGGAVMGSRVGEGISQTTDYLVPAGWGNALLKAGGKTIGRRLARKAASAAITPLITSNTGRQAAERLKRNYRVENYSGSPIVQQTENPVGLGEALGKGYLSGLAESISEQGGALLGYVPKILKTPASQMGQWLARNAKKLEGPQGKNFRKMLQWHGFPAELGEEYLSGVLDPVMTGETERIKDNFSAQNMLETAITVAAVSSMMGGASQINSLAKSGGRKRSTETVPEVPPLEKAAQEHLEAKKEWEKIKDSELRKNIAEVTAGDISPEMMWMQLEEMMQGKEITKTDLKHIQNYLTHAFSRDIAFGQALEQGNIRREEQLQQELANIKNLLEENDLHIFRRFIAPQKKWSYAIQPSAQVAKGPNETGSPISFRQFAETITNDYKKQWQKEAEEQRKEFIAGNLADLGGNLDVIPLNELKNKILKQISKPKSVHQLTREQINKVEQATPDDIGPFGPVFNKYNGRTLEGVYQLIKHKSGELKAVYFRPEIGYIDIIWRIGDQGGLRHSIGKHTKGDNKYESVEDFVRVMDDVIANGKFTYRQDNRFIFEHDGNKLVISKRIKDPKNTNIVIRKNWVVTMYRKNKSSAGENDSPDANTNHSENSNNEFQAQENSSLFPKWGYFGPITTEYRGRTEEGIKLLVSQKSGELADMYSIEGVDDHISIIWGTMADRGLFRILRNQVGEGKAYASVEELAKTLDDVMTNGKIVVPKTDRIVVVGKGKDRVALYCSGIFRKPYYKHSKPQCWVTSVYKKRELTPYRLPEGFYFKDDTEIIPKQNGQTNTGEGTGWEQLSPELRTMLKEQKGFITLSSKNPKLNFKISLPWGTRGYGLRNIIEKDIIRIAHYSSIDEMMDKLQKTLDNGEVYSSSDGKIIVTWNNNQLIMSKSRTPEEQGITDYSILSIYTIDTPTYEKLRE